MNRLVARALHLGWRVTRPLTGGARGMVLEGDRVLLVRHTYTAGWHLPGGGVEAGETFEAALARELSEEAAVTLAGRAELFGLYHNVTPATRRDHVALYVVREFARAPFEPTREIAAVTLHPLDALPDGTTEAVRRRVREVREGLPPAPLW